MISRRNFRMRLMIVLIPLALAFSARPAHASPMENVVFVMASDGGILASGWAQEQSFVEGLINTGMPLSGTRVGLVEFSTATNTVLPETDLTASTASTIISDVAALPYMNAATYMLDGVTAGINVLNNGASAGDTKFMVLLSNGIPNPLSSQNPCSTVNPNAALVRQQLASNNISVLEVMVGPNQETSVISCLVNNDPLQQVVITDTTAARTFIADVKADAPAPVPEPGGFTLGVLPLSLMALVAAKSRRKGAEVSLSSR